MACVYVEHNGTVLWTNFAADDLLCNFVLAQEKRRKALYYLREKPKVKAHVEAGFQFPRQPCNIYLIEKTLSLKSTVKQTPLIECAHCGRRYRKCPC